MKRFFITAIITIATISGIIGYNEASKTQRSAIDMANIDALTSTESPNDYVSLRLVPCSHSTGNECVYTRLDYPECYHKYYCN